jgi:translation initiation factor 5
MMNIAGLQSIEDANYRYKMPRLQAKVEGRGNGVKTVVINMKDVADALHRGPAEVTKFFGTGALPCLAMRCVAYVRGEGGGG